MRRLVVILIVVLMLAAVVVLIAKSSGGDKSVVFPNGVVVQVRGAFPGGRSVSSDKPWTATLRKVLPARWQSKLPPVTTISCGSTNQVVVFFDLTTTPWEWMAAVDDDGFAYPRSGGSCSSSIGNGRTLYGVPLEAFPRRQKAFRLDFFDARSKVIGQTRVANPLPVPPTEQSWQAQTMPIAQTNGEVALTLVSVKERTSQWGSHLDPKWQTQAFDPRWEHARVGYHRVADPTGNEGGLLSPKEQAWQIKTSVHRTRLEDFEADERMSVTNVAVPAPAQMIPLNVAAYCAEMKVVIEGLYGPGTLHVTNGLHRGMTTNSSGGSSTSFSGATTVESLVFKRPSFLLEVTGMSGRDELVIHLRDSLGRPVKAENLNNYRYRSSSVCIYQIGFDPTDQIQSLSLEVAVSRPKEFVFYISPKDIQPPE
jgi:hypothetical protein